MDEGLTSRVISGVSTKGLNFLRSGASSSESVFLSESWPASKPGLNAAKFTAGRVGTGT